MGGGGDPTGDAIRNGRDGSKGADRTLFAPGYAGRGASVNALSGNDSPRLTDLTWYDDQGRPTVSGPTPVYHRPERAVQAIKADRAVVFPPVRLHSRRGLFLPCYAPVPSTDVGRPPVLGALLPYEHIAQALARFQSDF